MNMPLATESMIAEIIAEQQLPADFIHTVEVYFWPLAQAIVKAHAVHGKTLVIGINGSQGSGKSTLAEFLAALFRDMSLQCAVLSIDDLYLTKARRQHLATTIHSMLGTRGVPGTHDVALGLRTITALKTAEKNTVTLLPRFNKATDDRFDETAWPRFNGRADIIILEGWCVGAEPQTDAELVTPINTLEADEDCDAIWRRYANTALANDYQQLFKQLDWQVMLAAPSFDCVYQWRKEQEDKLAKRMASQGGDTSGVMDAIALKRFIQHYERITRKLLIDMPKRADWLFTLAEDHQILAARTASDKH